MRFWKEIFEGRAAIGMLLGGIIGAGKGFSESYEDVLNPAFSEVLVGTFGYSFVYAAAGIIIGHTAPITVPCTLLTGCAYGIKQCCWKNPSNIETKQNEN